MKHQNSLFGFIFNARGVALSIFFVLCFSPLAQAQERYDGLEPAKKFDIRFGGFLTTNHDTTLRVDSNELGVGAVISLEDNLEVESSTQVFRLDGFYRFNERHMIDWTWYSNSREGTTEIINEEIKIGDEIYQVGDVIHTSMKTNTIKVGWAYSFINVRKYEAFIGAGLNINFANFSFANTLTVDGGGSTEEAEVKASPNLPLPTVNMGLRYNFTDRLALNFRSEVLTVNFGDVRGRMQDTYLLLDYTLGERWGIGGGINTMLLDVKVEDTEFDVSLNSKYTGLLFYGKYSF